MAIDIGMILSQWGDWGVYRYLLPALLIFAVVFGILTSRKILGENKGVHVIVALVVAILGVASLDQYVGRFYEQLFPRLGVGLAVIVALVILTSLFINDDEKKYWMWGISAIAIVVWILVTTGAFESIGAFMGYSSTNSEDLAALVIGGLLIVGIIIAVATSGGKEKEAKKTAAP